MGADSDLIIRYLIDDKEVKAKIAAIDTLVKNSKAALENLAAASTKGGGTTASDKKTKSLKETKQAADAATVSLSKNVDVWAKIAAVENKSSAADAKKTARLKELTARTEALAQRNKQLLTLDQRGVEVLARRAMATAGVVSKNSTLIAQASRMVIADKYVTASHANQIVMLKKLALQSEITAMAQKRSAMSYFEFVKIKAKALATYVGVGGVMFGAMNQASRGYGTFAEEEKAITYAARTASRPGVGLSREQIQKSMVAFTSQHVNTLTEYGEALYQTTSAMDDFKIAAFGAKGAIEATNITLGTNIILNGNVEETAKTLMSTWLIFSKGMKNVTGAVEQYQHIANTVLKTWADYQMDPDEFAGAMKYAGKAADMAGVSFEGLATMLGVLHNQGIRATTAGTGLRQVFMSFAQDKNKFITNIKELSAKYKINVNDLFDPNKPLDATGVLKAIRDVMIKLKGNKDFRFSQQDTEALVKGTSVRSYAVLATLIENFDTVIAKTAELKNATTDLAGTFNAMLKQAEGDPAQQLGILGKGINLVTAAFIQGVLKGKDFGKGLADIIKNMPRYIAKMEAAGKKMYDFAAAIAKICGGLGNMIKWLAALATAIVSYSIATKIGTMSLAIGNLGITVFQTGQIVKVFGITLGTIGPAAVGMAAALNAIAFVGFIGALTFTTGKVFELINAIYGLINAKNELAGYRTAAEEQAQFAAGRAASAAKHVQEQMGISAGAPPSGPISRESRGWTAMMGPEYKAHFGKEMGANIKSMSSSQLREEIKIAGNIGAPTGMGIGEAYWKTSERLRKGGQPAISLPQFEQATIYRRGLEAELAYREKKEKDRVAKADKKKAASLGGGTGGKDKAPKTYSFSYNAPTIDVLKAVNDLLATQKDTLNEINKRESQRISYLETAKDIRGLSEVDILKEKLGFSGKAASFVSSAQVATQRQLFTTGSQLIAQQIKSAQILAQIKQIVPGFDPAKDIKGYEFANEATKIKAEALVNQYKDSTDAATKYGEGVKLLQGNLVTLGDTAQDTALKMMQLEMQFAGERLKGGITSLFGGAEASYQQRKTQRKVENEALNKQFERDAAALEAANTAVAGGQAYKLMPSWYGTRTKTGKYFEEGKGKIDKTLGQETYMKSKGEVNAQAYANGWLAAQGTISEAMKSSITGAMDRLLGKNLFTSIAENMVSEFIKVYSEQMFAQMAMSNGLLKGLFPGGGGASATGGGAGAIAATVGALTGGGGFAQGWGAMSDKVYGTGKKGGGFLGLGNVFKGGGGLKSLTSMKGLGQSGAMMGVLDLAQGNVESGIGGILGSLVAGPVGGLIGGLAGSLLKKKPGPAMVQADAVQEVRVINFSDLARETAFILPSSSYFSNRVGPGNVHGANRPTISIGVMNIGPGASESDGARFITGANAAMEGSASTSVAQDYSRAKRRGSLVPV